MDLAYFFRCAEDAKAPSVPVWLLVVFLLALVLMARYVKAPKTYAVVAICLQLAILSWYVCSNLLWNDGLPLYHCRISLWAISIGLLFNIRGKFILWLSYLGIATSLMVLLMRDMNAYSFPHITNFYYFFGHGVIFLIAVAYIEKYEEKLSIKESVIYALILHAVVYVINICLHSNYSYLCRLPIINSPAADKFSFVIVTVIVVAIVFLTQKIVELRPVRSFFMGGKELTAE